MTRLRFFSSIYLRKMKRTGIIHLRNYLLLIKKVHLNIYKQ